MVFDHFEVLQLSLEKIEDQLRPSDSPLDIVSSKIIKQAFDTVGASV